MVPKFFCNFLWKSILIYNIIKHKLENNFYFCQTCIYILILFLGRWAHEMKWNIYWKKHIQLLTINLSLYKYQYEYPRFGQKRSGN